MVAPISRYGVDCVLLDSAVAWSFIAADGGERLGHQPGIVAEICCAIQGDFLLASQFLFRLYQPATRPHARATSTGKCAGVDQLLGAGATWIDLGVCQSVCGLGRNKGK